jgi:hypothetical protein
MKISDLLTESQNPKTPPSKPRNFVAKNAKGGGAGAHKDKSKTIPRKEKHKKAEPMFEEPEGDTLKNSLHTIIRVATHLDKRLDVNDQFPEWVSEKIGAVKVLMVGVMDYIISDQEMHEGQHPVCDHCGERHEVQLDERGKASRSLCLSSKPNSELGASNLASCKSQGLRAREGEKSHKLGKTAKSRVVVGGHKLKGKKYGGKLPDWS